MTVYVKKWVEYARNTLCYAAVRTEDLPQNNMREIWIKFENLFDKLTYRGDE